MVGFQIQLKWQFVCLSVQHLRVSVADTFSHRVPYATVYRYVRFQALRVQCYLSLEVANIELYCFFFLGFHFETVPVLVAMGVCVNPNVQVVFVRWHFLDYRQVATFKISWKLHIFLTGLLNVVRHPLNFFSNLFIVFGVKKTSAVWQCYVFHIVKCAFYRSLHVVYGLVWLQTAKQLLNEVILQSQLDIFSVDFPPSVWSVPGLRQAGWVMGL